MVSGTELDKLSSDDRKEFRRCESVIKRGVRTFIDVGTALKVIQENQYYRERYDTFEQYCKDRWEFSRAHAYRLIESAKVVETLVGGGIDDIDGDDSRLPLRESQVRELGRLQDDRARQEVWEKSIAAAADGKVTAKLISEKVAEYIEEHPEVEVKGRPAENRSVPTAPDSLRAVKGGDPAPDTEGVAHKFEIIQESGGLASWKWNVITAKPKPTLHQPQLSAPKYTSPVSNSNDPEDATVFIAPNIDLFGPGLQPKWIDDILVAAEESPKWTFLTITKEYAKAAQYTLPDNVWLGAAIETTEQLIQAEKAFTENAATYFLYLNPLRQELQLVDPTPFSWIVICGSDPQPPWNLVWSMTEQAYEFEIPVFWNSDLRVRAAARPLPTT